MARFQQSLPDLAEYRSELVSAGAPFPLPYVSVPSEGLLQHLPKPAEGKRGWPWTIQTAPRLADASSVPSITVAIPSYNQGSYLEETIRSVLLQNYPRLQLVVMDGGSNDASIEIIRRYGPWLSYARSAPDRGQAHAVNLGLSLAGGDIVAWLNSDDMHLPQTLLTVAQHWNKGAEFIHGDQLELDQATGFFTYGLAEYIKARFARWGGLVFQPAAFWSATKHRPLWEEQWCALDYELWIRLLPGMRIRYTSTILAVSRKHAEAKTFDQKIKTRWEADAARNGLAHPEVYANTAKNRLIATEYSILQHGARKWRGRHAASALARALADAGWDSNYENAKQVRW
jgi:glycosyltransferase involved in cell wall biosynthesis